MKMAISFICGAVICGLIIIGVKPVLPALAETTNSGATNSGTESENTTPSIVDQISGFDKIYRDALTEPFIKAESKISDPDIADYYHGLMEKTGLTNPGS
jgi:hypothetical protein